MKNIFLFWLTGALAGLLFALFEYVKFSFSLYFLSTGFFSLLYIAAFIFVTPILISIFLRMGVLFFPKRGFFLGVFVSYVLASVLLVLFLIQIHHVADPEYKNRIAYHKFERAVEKMKSFERRNGARVTSTDISLAYFERTEQKTFDFETLLLAPLSFLPVALFLSWVFSGILKRIFTTID